MANPPKKKGTGAETELRDKLAKDHGIYTVRTSPGSLWDLERAGTGVPLNLLATRPDRGEWLVTMTLEDAGMLISTYDTYVTSMGAIHIEVKRYARFSLHNIWNKKFGGKK